MFTSHLRGVLAHPEDLPFKGKPKHVLVSEFTNISRGRKRATILVTRQRSQLTILVVLARYFNHARQLKALYRRVTY